MKKVVGITAEYNPFHYGHLYQISEIRKTLGEDCVVVAAMSGDFVQRGEPAVFSKFARAEAAVRCGVDLVVELPVQWSCASAGYFAKGAVSVLSSLGMTHLAFGSESGDLEAIKKAAERLSSPKFGEYVKNMMKSSPELSYPAAREEALRAFCGEEISSVLKAPNDTLAVEYLIALSGINKDIEPLCVKRAGAGHDSRGITPVTVVTDPEPDFAGPSFASASYIRSLLKDNEDISAFVPPKALEVYSREMSLRRGPVFSGTLEREMLSRLIMFVKEYFSALPDASEGIGNRIYEAVRDCNTIDEIVRSAKTRRFPESRVRRLIVQACLGITPQSFGPRGTASLPPYVRPLAFSEKGRGLLSDVKAAAAKARGTISTGEAANKAAGAASNAAAANNAAPDNPPEAASNGEGPIPSLPILTKPADVRETGPLSEKVFSVGAHSHDLYELAFLPSDTVKRGNDYRFSPLFVHDDE